MSPRRALLAAIVVVLATVLVAAVGLLARDPGAPDRGALGPVPHRPAPTPETEALFREKLPSFDAQFSRRPADCGPRACTRRPLLPDLVQEPPTGFVVTPGPRGPRLGFVSAVSNLGDGPLLVEGRRDGARMSADQIIRREDGTVARARAVGQLVYARAPDHAHWHYRPFERYELRRAGGGGAVVRSNKSGFCLGDRYRVSPAPAAMPASAVFTTRCGLASPGLTTLREGISVGYGDDYAATLEGQYVELAGVPAGRYVLVHRVNAGRRLHEADHTNNASSALLRLAWRGARADVRVLAVCPGRALCAAGA